MLILQCIAAQPVGTIMSDHPGMFTLYLSTCNFLSTRNGILVLADYGTTVVSGSKELRQFCSETKQYPIEVLTGLIYDNQFFFLVAAIVSFTVFGFCNLALDLEEAAFAAF